MRTFLARLAAVLALAAPAVVVLGSPAGATSVLPCAISVHVSWQPVGSVGALVSASTSGTCFGDGWTSCDIALSGAGGPLVSLRSAGYGGCSSDVEINGVLGTPYTAVGRVGYSAANVPANAGVAVVVPGQPV